MEAINFGTIYPDEVLKEIFPPSRAGLFFEALYGDAKEGAYTIGLKFKGLEGEPKRLVFELELQELPGKCLACNLTYGLPRVFSRHPVINIKGVVEELQKRMSNGIKFGEWSLGRTREKSMHLHVIPLRIELIAEGAA
ncbi:MAG: pancreas/duodenum homeobox protein 1 [Thermodesulfobacteriota bacterium]